MAKRLMKSSEDVKLDGVCAGIAEYFGIDPTIVRIIFAVFTISGGAGIILYLLLMFAMPRNTGSYYYDAKNNRSHRETESFDGEDEDDYNESVRETKSKDTLDEEESWRDF